MPRAPVFFSVGKQTLIQKYVKNIMFLKKSQLSGENRFWEMMRDKPINFDGEHVGKVSLVGPFSSQVGLLQRDFFWWTKQIVNQEYHEVIAMNIFNTAETLQSISIWSKQCCMTFASANIWVFPKIVVPQIGWFTMENPIKMDDLGVPPFSETPISERSPNPFFSQPTSWKNATPGWLWRFPAGVAVAYGCKVLLHLVKYLMVFLRTAFRPFSAVTGFHNCHSAANWRFTDAVLVDSNVAILKVFRRLFGEKLHDFCWGSIAHLNQRLLKVLGLKVQRMQEIFFPQNATHLRWTAAPWFKRSENLSGSQCVSNFWSTPLNESQSSSDWYATVSKSLKIVTVTQAKKSLVLVAHSFLSYDKCCTSKKKSGQGDVLKIADPIKTRVLKTASMSQWPNACNCQNIFEQPPINTSDYIICSYLFCTWRIKNAPAVSYPFLSRTTKVILRRSTRSLTQSTIKTSARAHSSNEEHSHWPEWLKCGAQKPEDLLEHPMKSWLNPGFWIPIMAFYHHLSLG